jgi:hypothetical protein
MKRSSPARTKQEQFHIEPNRAGRKPIASDVRSRLGTGGERRKKGKETAMKKQIIGAAAALMLLAGMSGSARADGPWCAFYDVSTYNCGFHSYQQCLATISGAGGWCARNPAWRGRGRY